MVCQWYTIKPAIFLVHTLYNYIGYETCIAKTWRRLFAEFIDILLVSIILKWFIPDLDYRLLIIVITVIDNELIN